MGLTAGGADLGLITIDSFPGLRLDDPVGGVGATTAENIDLSVPGQLKPRWGRTNATWIDPGNVTYSSPYKLIDTHSISTDSVCVLDTAKLTRLTAPGGVATATQTTITANTPSVDAIVFGTPSTGPRLYFSDTGALSYWDGSSVTAVGATTTPKGGFFAIQPKEARLVCAYSAINSSPVSSRVHFSNAGDPATWTSTDFVDLNPGDGEVITGAATLGDLVVVFKETRAYVFYGNSTDTTGGSVFNYRTVNLGDRITVGNLRPGRFGTDGRAIYYVACNGLYRFSGETPELLSGAISPVFGLDGTPIGGTAETFAHATATQLFVGSYGTANTYVFHRLTGEWTTYSFKSRALMNSQSSSRSDFYVFVHGDTTLSELSPAAILDPSNTEFTGTYVLHRSDFGDPGRKRLRQVRVQGVWSSANVATTVSTDNGSFDSGTLFTAPSSGDSPLYDRVARRGYTFALKVAAFAIGSSWTVSQIVLDVDSSE